MKCKLLRRPISFLLQKNSFFCITMHLSHNSYRPWYIACAYYVDWASQVALVVKNLPTDARDTG